MIKVFFIEPTGRDRVWLRRYEGGSSCPAGGYHQAMTPIGEEPDSTRAIGDDHPHDDERWPAFCEKCGNPFSEADEWQRFRRAIYRRPDTGEEMVLGEVPVGAVWNATWFVEHRIPPCFDVGEDGRCLVVQTPGGEWPIDSRASNCTMPDDNTHKCWVRHGLPEDGTLHVDKNGHTCAAGAGSIQCGSYHGFLHNGYLTSC